MRYIFLFGLLLLSLAAAPCSCLSSGKINEEQYNSYNLIITGKVVKLVEKEFNRIIYIKVVKYFKGNKKTTIVKIETPVWQSACGITPKIGENWLLFAYKQGKIYTTNLCTRTKSMNDKAWNYNKSEIDDDLKFLESKIKDATNTGLKNE